MEPLRYYKYLIINIDCKTYDINILGEAFTKHQAIELLNEYLDEKYEFNSSLKCYYLNEDTIEINKYYPYTLWPKETINKIIIKKHPSTGFPTTPL